MPEPRLAEMVTQIDAFFGFARRSSERALQRPTRLVAGLDIAQIVEDAASASGAEAVRTRVRQAALEEGNMAALRALYTYRTLDVPDLSVYLQAARYSSQIGICCRRSRRPTMRCEPWPRSRAASRFSKIRTGLPCRTRPRDSPPAPAATRHCCCMFLLERALAADDPARSSLETLFTETDSFVRSARFCISVSGWPMCPRPKATSGTASPTRLEIALPAPEYQCDIVRLNSFLPERNQGVRIVAFLDLSWLVAGFNQPQQARRHVPPPAVIADYGDRLLVIAGQDSENTYPVVKFKCNAIANAELQHGLMGMRLTYESEALHDTLIQVYEFGFGQMIYVDSIHAGSRRIIRSRPNERKQRQLRVQHKSSGIVSQQAPDPALA